MGAVRRISVPLGQRRYDVRIGSRHLGRLGVLLARLKLGTHAVIVTNPTLVRHHARAVRRVLMKAGFPVDTLTVPDTERSKSLGTLGQLIGRLAGLDRPGRRPFLVLVGGGVVGDLGGLVAGLYRRGIPYVQVPTTLLAQVDSSLGGKTGVDLPEGKNLVGLFNQPSIVFIELDFLSTLPDRQFRSGLAEVAKCGVIQDPVLFKLLERTQVTTLRRSPGLLAQVVARAVQVKASVVGRDERETLGIRTILNFGHTLGHALETAARYDTRICTHGEAVAVGMIAATRISQRMGLIPDSAAGRIHRLMDHLGLPASLRGMKLSSILRAMAHDKKWAMGRNRWVLPAGIGRAVVRRGVPERIVRESIRTVLEG